jgi:riboflavin kinase/FMN adenylyltransferase
MRIFDAKTGFNELPAGTVLSIGNFDGVHTGHQQILRQAGDARPGTPLTVMTFDPPPAAILHPEKTPGALTPLPLKARLLEEQKVDFLVVIEDCLKLLNLSPEDFIDRFLMNTITPCLVAEGPNFHFGYGRSGSVETLGRLGKTRGFDVLEVPFAEVEIEKNQRAICSSTLIRQFLEKGSVEPAAKVLSRPYRLIGQTVPGRGIGRTLGFPTANIHPENQIIPAEGVYAGWVVVGDSLEQVCGGGQMRPAAFSLGRAKTFVSDHPVLIEAHLLERDVEDLYGKYLAMDFVKRIRGQQRFDTRQKLAEQIQKDCQIIRETLKR